MARGLAYTVAAALLSVGLGCGFLQQSGSATTVASPPEKAASEIELPTANKADIDPEHMTLTGKEWFWIRTIYNNNTIVVPIKPGVFTLTFNNDNTLNATTDCNRMSGSYETNERLLTIGKLAATRMFCPDSQEAVFTDMLSQVSAFLFTSKGELVLELQYDNGQILLK